MSQQCAEQSGLISSFTCCAAIFQGVGVERALQRLEYVACSDCANNSSSRAVCRSRVRVCSMVITLAGNEQRANTCIDTDTPKCAVDVLSIRPSKSTPEVFAARVKDEVARWAATVKKTGMVPQE